HCFGCGESGDVFSFMMKYHHLTFPDALKDLANRYHIDLPERKLSDADRARMRKREQLYQVKTYFLFQASERGQHLVVIILDVLFYEFAKSEIAVSDLFFDLNGEHLVDILHAGILLGGLSWWFTVYILP
ncbi:MAG: hypothetical protein JRF04_00585, partial [Deltaproteobacteria bacterium]|nr:hypothetical protein [Deltaproteobacteria bacterium]